MYMYVCNLAAVNFLSRYRQYHGYDIALSNLSLHFNKSSTSFRSLTFREATSVLILFNLSKEDQRCHSHWIRDCLKLLL